MATPIAQTVATAPIIAARRAFWPSVSIPRRKPRLATGLLMLVMVRWASNYRSDSTLLSATSLTERMTPGSILSGPMRDEKILRERLEQLRGQLLQWGTPNL